MAFTLQGTPTKIEKVGQTLEAVKFVQLELPFPPEKKETPAQESTDGQPQ